MKLIKQDGYFKQLDNLRKGQCGNQKKELEFQLKQVTSSLYPDFDKLWLVELWGDFRVKAFEVKNSLGKQSAHHCYFKTLDKANEFINEIRKELGVESDILKFINIVKADLNKQIRLHEYSCLDEVERLKEIKKEYENLLSLINNVNALNRFIENEEDKIPKVWIYIKEETHETSLVQAKKQGSKIILSINTTRLDCKNNIDSLSSKLSKHINAINNINKVIGC